MRPRGSLSQGEAHADTSQAGSRTWAARWVPKGRVVPPAAGRHGWLGKAPRSSEGFNAWAKGKGVTAGGTACAKARGMPSSPGCAPGKECAWQLPAKPAARSHCLPPHPAPLPSLDLGVEEEPPHPEGSPPRKKVQGAWATPAPTLPQAHQPGTWPLSLGAGWEGLEGKVSYLPSSAPSWMPGPCRVKEAPGQETEGSPTPLQ